MKRYTSTISKCIALGIILASICIAMTVVYYVTNESDTPVMIVAKPPQAEKTEQQIVQDYVNSKQRNFPPNLSLQPVFTKEDFFGWKAMDFTRTSGQETQYEGLQNVQKFVVKHNGVKEILNVTEFNIADPGVFHEFLQSTAAIINPQDREAYLITIPNTVPNAGVFIVGDKTALLIQPEDVGKGYGWPMKINPFIPALLQNIVLP
ncbi:MAG: hypothetical protein WC477_03760 [Patescibacteria group bacterium]